MKRMVTVVEQKRIFSFSMHSMIFKAWGFGHAYL